MAGVEIVADRKTKEPSLQLGDRIGVRMTELGLWAQHGTTQSFSRVCRIALPITITVEELKKGSDIMEKAFASTKGTLPLY
jgi:4-aminobutyrate aminotransferase-like enzyme